MNFEGEDAWLREFPLLATICYEAYQLDRDEAFLRQAYGSIVNYFNYMFIEMDRDGDYLVESTNNSAAQIPRESVAFNAMLALDLENLARVTMELNLPLRGLFWFDCTRMIKERLVSACYDPDGCRFVSEDEDRTGVDGSFDMFSILPAYFTNAIGENVSNSLLRRYMANPANYHTGPDRSASTSPVEFSQTRMRRIAALLGYILVADLFERNGMELQAHDYRRDNAPSLPAASAEDHPSADFGVYDGFWSCRISNFNRKPLFPRLIELKLFAKIARSQDLLNPIECEDLTKDLERTAWFVDSWRSCRGSISPGEQPDAHGALMAVRGIYQSISMVKDRLKRSASFSPRDRSEFPGFDLERAFDELVKDAIRSLQRVESMIFECQGSGQGFQITSALLKERAVVGETVTIRLNIGATRAPEKIRSIVLSRGSVTDTLVTRSPHFEVSPQNDPLIADHSFWLPADWLPGIHLIPFTVDVVMGTGERRKVYFVKSVYVDAPLSYYVTFPEGNTLQQWGVPLDIHLSKHAPYAMSVQVGWFSPSGLSLKEGASQALYMQENQAEAKARVHVLAPSPIRPGAFPFILKVFGNGMDAGTVSSTLYKHFQWIFVGPFEAGADALAKEYPPERPVNLLDTFNGPDGKLVWGMLPANAIEENGEVFLGNLLSPNSVGYLYTVIKSTRNIRCPVSLAGTAPARLFVNGEIALETNPASPYTSPSRSVYLNEGLNDILIKVAGNENTKISLNLGDDESITSDEFNNNLWELVEGFKNFYERRIQQFEVASTTQKIATLRYFSQDANSVSVIGSFNGWTPDNSPLRQVSKGVWEISLHLPPGKYAYRFLVNNSSQVLDPQCPIEEPDGYGGENSILYIK